MYGGGIIVSVVIDWLTPVIYNHLPSMAAKLYGVTLIPYFWMFLTAAFVAEFRDMILPFLKKYWWVFISLLILKKTFLRMNVVMNHDYTLFGVLLLFAGVLGFSYRYPRINIKTDISYGIYIYHRMEYIFII